MKEKRYMMNQKIFKAYDVRGVYPDELNEKTAEDIARALAKHFLSKVKSKKSKVKIIVGRDGRLSSPALYQAALKALEIRNSKLEILPVGLITTPMLYFLVNHLKADGGIMVTASHNPKEYNGLKVVGRKAKPINGIEIRRLVDETR